MDYVLCAWGLGFFTLGDRLDETTYGAMYRSNDLYMTMDRVAPYTARCVDSEGGRGYCVAIGPNLDHCKWDDGEGDFDHFVSCEWDVQGMMSQCSIEHGEIVGPCVWSQDFQNITQPSNRMTGNCYMSNGTWNTCLYDGVAVSNCSLGQTNVAGVKPWKDCYYGSDKSTFCEDDHGTWNCDIDDGDLPSDGIEQMNGWGDCGYSNGSWGFCNRLDDAMCFIGAAETEGPEGRYPTFSYVDARY